MKELPALVTVPDIERFFGISRPQAELVVKHLMPAGVYSESEIQTPFTVKAYASEDVLAAFNPAMGLTQAKPSGIKPHHQGPAPA